MKEIEILFPEPIKLTFLNKKGQKESFIIEELSTERISRVCVKIARITQKMFGDPELGKLLNKSGIDKALNGSEVDIKSVIGTLIGIIEEDMFDLAALLIGRTLEEIKQLPMQVVSKILLYSFDMNKEIVKDFTELGKAGKLGKAV